MKIKVSEATPIQLDYLVAKCEQVHLTQASVDYQMHEYGCLVKAHGGKYSPSTDWAQGGPIIEREGIDLYCNVPTNASHPDQAWRGSWRARYHRCGFGTEMFYGPTPLIAAMRCTVAFRLGEEVEIPDELTT